jgi:N-acetylmuramoyl-L-alanine amidase
MREITHIVMHCTATPGTADIGAAEVNRWHLQRGWSGIGYHFVIRRNGTVEAGRPIERKGAHVAGFNAKSVGISLAGGVASDGATPVDNFTQDQLVAARDLVLDLMATYRIPRDNVMGHKEVIANITHGSPKACPVFSMDGFRDMVAERELAGVDGEHSEPWGSEMSDDDEKEEGGRIHTVVSGDTLWGIANRYRTTISEIRAMNPSLSGDLIHPGDLIRV